MIAELIFLILVAILISFSLMALGRTGPGPFAGLLFFFLIFLLTGWAASRWLVPTGPTFYDVYWGGPLVATLLLALIMLAVLPGHRRQRRDEEILRQSAETPSETETRHAIEAGFSLFFWFALVGLIIVIIAGYLL